MTSYNTRYAAGAYTMTKPAVSFQLLVAADALKCGEAQVTVTNGGEKIEQVKQDILNRPCVGDDDCKCPGNSRYNLICGKISENVSDIDNAVREFLGKYGIKTNIGCQHRRTCVPNFLTHRCVENDKTTPTCNSFSNDERQCTLLSSSCKYCVDTNDCVSKSSMCPTTPCSTYKTRPLCTVQRKRDQSPCVWSKGGTCVDKSAVSVGSDTNVIGRPAAWPESSVVNVPTQPILDYHL